MEELLHKCKGLLDKGSYSQALQIAEEALSQDPQSYAAHFLAGKASFSLGDTKRARAEYRKAITQDSFKLLGWEGMAELQLASGELQEAEQTYAQLLRLALNGGTLAKQREYFWRLAETCDRLGNMEEAEEHLKSLMDMDLTPEQKLEALCFLADVQVKAEQARMEREVHQAMAAQERQHGRILRSASSVRLGIDASRADEQDSEGGLAETLKAIVGCQGPTPKYVRFHEYHLQRYLSRLGAYPPKSAARQEKRVEALKECMRMITSRPGGCCTPFPYEAAIWLLEEQEEIFGGHRPSSRNSSVDGSCMNGGHTSPRRSSTSGAPGFNLPRRNHSNTNLLMGSALPRTTSGSPGELPRTTSATRITVTSSLPRSTSSAGLLASALPRSTSNAQGLAGMGGPSPSSQPAPLLSGMPRGGQAGQSIGDLQPLAARMPRTEAQPLGSALPRASGYGGAAALGTSNASQPSSLNWFRGDSIRGVDREFIYQVLREQEEASSTASVEGSAAEQAAATGHGSHKVKDFGRRLAHQFPWSPAAFVAVGLALRRRQMTEPGAPSSLAKRRRIAQCLKQGVYSNADSAAGWKALAELQYQNRQFQEAYDTAVKGLEWSVRRRRAGHETLTSFALALRLVVARCLRRLGRLDEAEYNFKILAGWITEGESAFNAMSGSPPMSIRQQALRGIAKVQLERGDRKAALHQYERILGKALIGRGPPAEPWAHSEYAWLLFEDGNLELAKQQLEMALRSAQREVMLITDAELADVHYKLGRICWTMGGHMQTEPHQARAHFEAATAVESDVQALAFGWLGRWHEVVAQDFEKAQECYEKALTLDPKDSIAGHTAACCCFHATPCTAEDALEKLQLQGKIVLSANKSGLLAERIAARKAEGKAQNKLGKNVTEISRIRYEGALERTLS